MAAHIAVANRLERHLYDHGACDAIAVAATTFWLLFLDDKLKLGSGLLWLLAVSDLVFLLIAPLLALAGVVSAAWYLAKRNATWAAAIPRILLGVLFLCAWWRTTRFFELP